MNDDLASDSCLSLANCIYSEECTKIQDCGVDLRFLPRKTRTWISLVVVHLSI
jgi:hypothetical protein